MNYENVKKLAKALDAIVEVGEDVAEDGKVDFSDLSQVTKLIGPIQDLVDVYGSKEGLKDELLAFLGEKLDELLA